MKQPIKSCLFALLWAWASLLITPARAQTPADQTAAEDDWWLPTWVQPTPGSGFYSTHVGPLNDNHEVQLAWKDIEPQEGQFDWSRLQQALAANKHHVWVRFFASDARHIPAWFKQKHPSLATVHWRWPDAPYRDIYDWTGQDSPGDFYPMWDPRVETAWRAVLQSFGSQGFARHPRFAFSYFPHGWRWGEYTLKWVPEMARAGFTAEQYVAWFKRLTQDYVGAMDGQAGKLVYTGGGQEEWVEYWNEEATYRHWNEVLNPTTGGNVLSQHTLGQRTGVRDGFTEVFNAYADRPDWGTSLQTKGSYRYSVVDEVNPLVAATDRFFGTENEDFQYNWPDVNQYYFVKMASLNALRLRINQVVPGDPAVGSAVYAYLRNTLGKHAGNSPDAWVALRQYARAPVNQWFKGVKDDVGNIRNFERWLTQREVSGGQTVATYYGDPPAAFKTDNGGSYEALRTNHATANDYVYFAVDDQFLQGGSTDVYVKVTYLDNFAGTWQLQYDGASNAYQALSQANVNDGKWKTVTFRLPDAQFNNRQTGGMDFRLYNGGTQDLTARFVRVVKAQDPATVAPATFAGVYTLKARHSGQLLDVKGVGTADGDSVVQWPATGGANQQWQATATGNGYYKLTAQHSGKVLAVSGASPNNGARVQQYTSNDTDAQRWKMEATTDGYYKLTGKASGKCLDVASVSSRNGAQVHQWDYVGGANQQWRIEPVTLASPTPSASTASVSAAAAATPALAGPAALSAYPNPSPDGKASLVLTAKTVQTATVQVRNHQGRLVRLFTVPLKPGTTHFKLPGSLAPNTYFVITKLDGQPQYFNLQVR